MMPGACLATLSGVHTSGKMTKTFQTWMVKPVYTPALTWFSNGGYRSDQGFRRLEMVLTAPVKRALIELKSNGWSIQELS